MRRSRALSASETGPSLSPTPERPKSPCTTPQARSFVHIFYRSDHWSFAKYGVPIAFFFTGFHPDYHRPTDTVEKINFDKLTRIVRYVYDIAFELGEADARPMVEESLWQKLKRKGSKTPAAPVRKN